jgi:hypothetical protein
MSGSFSEEAVSWLYANYPEVLDSTLFNFVACQRPNGTVYGTSGTCRKGTEVELRRAESVEYLNNSITLLKQKRDKAPPEGKERITRLIDKLEADLEKIKGRLKDSNTINTGGYKASPKSTPDFSNLKPEKSRNESYGFMGSSKNYYTSGLDKRWEETSKALQSLGIKPIYARRLLDSSWGRHLSDELSETPSSQVREKVHKLLKKQSAFGKKQFNRLLKEVMVDDYDD